MKILDKTLLAAGIGAALLLSACATNQPRDAAVVKVRSDLTSLQSNPELASRAPLEIQDAETAVRAAEQAETADDKDQREQTGHLTYVADKKVQAAMSTAQAKLEEDQRKNLTAENSKIQLDARTLEADRAKNQALVAQAQSEAAQQQAAVLAAQNAAAAQQNQALRSEADMARARADQLQAEIAMLEAKKTDRGLVLTVGDLLFTTGRSDLKPGGVANLDRLVSFLNKVPEATVRIEGHTDNVGGQSYNQGLSERRAQSVASYLTSRGVPSSRLTTTGLGYSMPVADNKTAAGKQANRRVELIVQNTPTS